MIGFPPCFHSQLFLFVQSFLVCVCQIQDLPEKKTLPKRQRPKTCQVILFIREVWKNDENHKGCWFRVGWPVGGRKFAFKEKKTRRFECQEGFEGCLMMSEVLFLWLDDDDDDEDDDDVFSPFSRILVHITSPFSHRGLTKSRKSNKLEGFFSWRYKVRWATDYFLSLYVYMGVSKNRGTPKWMVYNGKPYEKWMIWGEKPTIFGNTHMHTFRRLLSF